MARKSQVSDDKPTRTLTVEARENQLAAMAMDLAEKQLREGTASPLIINHFLKIGSTPQRLQNEMLGNKTKLTAAQTDAIEASKKNDELYSKAIKAMGIYSGKLEEDDEEY